jgi:hypothetical protein
MVMGRLPNGLESMRDDIPAIFVLRKHGLPTTEKPFWDPGEMFAEASPE